VNKACSVPILRYEPANLRGEPLAPRGSVVVFLAAEGSDQLGAIRDTAEKDGYAESLLKRTDVVDEDGYRATVTYAGQTLAANVPVPRDGRVVRLILPYAGGELDASALIVATDGDRAVEGVAVRHDPPLTAVEQAALTLLPKDLLSVNLGAALAGGIAGDNDEERRRQEEENRRAAEEARNERAAEQGEARAEAAEARAEERREARQGGLWGSRIEIHMLDATVKTISSLQAATTMLEIRKELLRDRQLHG
jgi:hypothetical protein